MGKIRWLKLWVNLALVAAALAGLVGRADEPNAKVANSASPKVRIVLAGDSTVTDAAGWGVGFAKCLADDVECLNLSRGGRSSKSFINEGLWKKCLDAKPDYVLIQFGHNDQPGKGVDRETDLPTYRGFMTQYVDDARAAGIKPVLVTSISRRQWGKDDDKIHSTLAAIRRRREGDRRREESPAHRSPRIVDRALREDSAKKGAYELSPMKDNADKTGKEIDNTHLNAKGSEVIGPIVAEELGKAVPELASHIKSSQTADASPSGPFQPYVGIARRRLQVSRLVPRRQVRHLGALDGPVRARGGRLVRPQDVHPGRAGLQVPRHALRPSRPSSASRTSTTSGTPRIGTRRS